MHRLYGPRGVLAVELRAWRARAAGERERWVDKRKGEMRRHTLQAILLLLALGPVSAGGADWRGGIVVGANRARIHFANPKFLPLEEDRYRPVTMGRAGVSVRYRLAGPLAIESGLFVDGRGQHIDASSETYKSSSDFHMYYLASPLLVTCVGPGRRVRPVASLGAEFGYLLRARTVVIFNDEVLGAGDVRDEYPKTDGAFVAGGGLLLSNRVSLQGVYKWGLSNLNESQNRSEHHFYHRVLSFVVTYWLGTGS